MNSSVSQVTLSGVNIEGNGGNGVHFVHHENFGTAPSFCKSANFGEEQNYPVKRSHVQDRNQFPKNCDQVSFFLNFVMYSYILLKSWCPEIDPAILNFCNSLTNTT